jgi:hypothetical protein
VKKVDVKQLELVGIVTCRSVYALSKDFQIKILCGSKKACLEAEAANLQMLSNSLMLLKPSQTHLREKMMI